ncbi:hypothetical protein FB45DRAFT_840170 [Roridomyces roridus]|uniref:MYND-type domain-containing protein n=1 Tax=Roridomyces roridus TaxID=1738132 RepID=A0AAD7FG86_9AGAR|nr:hypothetical protein FB45DRAFT_840170 [Roridomyces roridus]
MEQGSAGLPDVQTHPMDWIRETDLITKRRNDPSLPLEPDRRGSRGQPESFFEFVLNPAALQETVALRRISCVDHYRFSCLLEVMLVEQDFESKWITLGSEEQTRHFIAAFQRLEHPANFGGMGSMGLKMDIPELGLDELLGPSRDGKGFFDLLKLFLLPNNQEPPKQPFVLQNAGFDALIGWKPDDTSVNRKTYHVQRRSERTRYILLFLRFVIASLEGRDPRIVTHNNFCDACLKPEDETNNGEMSVCSQCSAIGRHVRYCDRKCQQDAWKIHKRSCGKPLEAGTALQDVPSRETSSRPDIPSIVKGYHRSAHLLRQISRLNVNREVDYVVAALAPAHVEYLMYLRNPHSAASFMVMREYAMSSVGPRAEAGLLYVYRSLQTWISTHGVVTEEVLRNQLRREYGATFDNVLVALERGERPMLEETVSREEIDKVLGHLKTLGRFKEQLKNYVSGAGESWIMILRAGPNKDVCVSFHYPFDLYFSASAPS